MTDWKNYDNKRLSRIIQDILSNCDEIKTSMDSCLIELNKNNAPHGVDVDTLLYNLNHLKDQTEQIEKNLIFFAYDSEFLKWDCDD